MTSPAWDRHQPVVPWDVDGNMMHYPAWNVTWDLLYPFKASMEIDGMRSGRSAKYLILKDVDTGKTYPMFVSDIVDFIQGGGEIHDRQLHAVWSARKKGANYGIGVHKP